MPKYDLSFSPPVMNAAGMLGFIPNLRGAIDLSCLGAFVTNPISAEARSPAQGTRFLAYTGGFLLHTGFPNPGLKAALRRYSRSWARSSLPIILHLLANNPEEVNKMAKRVEGLEGVIGLELGLPSGIEAEAAARIVEAATGELPILARLPLEQALQLTPAVLAAGAAAVSLGPPRGVLCDANGKLLNGRLYGPSLFPMALHTVRTLARMGATVIGAGGIYSLAEVEVMLAAGASAVQLDIILWQSKFGFAKGLGALCGPHNTIKFRSNKEQ